MIPFHRNVLPIPTFFVVVDYDITKTRVAFAYHKVLIWSNVIIGTGASN